jgi:hypothetical protein
MPGGTEERSEKFRMVGVLAEIRTEHFSNMKLTQWSLAWGSVRPREREEFLMSNSGEIIPFISI